MPLCDLIYEHMLLLSTCVDDRSADGGKFICQARVTSTEIFSCLRIRGHASMAKLTKPVAPPADARQKRVVILGLPPVDALDVIGPAEVFAWANQMADGGMAP